MHTHTYIHMYRHIHIHTHIHSYPLTHTHTHTHTHARTRPAGWGCRIRRLHHWRGVRPPPNGATCWPWAATRKALGQDPGGWAVINPVTEWSMACNTLLWPLVGQAVGLGPIRSIGWSCHVLVPVYFSPECTIQSAFAEQFPTLYFIGARRRGLSVNCVESRVLTTVKFSGTKLRN